ncbi:hypothetical protein INR49_030260 [Caranx melampygus]|nr:hypothetical protein INR49_030260 [Caranx melampygus]
MPNRELMTWQAATHQVRKAKKPRKKSGVRTDRSAVKVADRPLGSTGAAVGITSAGVTPGVSSPPVAQEKSPTISEIRVLLGYRRLLLSPQQGRSPPIGLSLFAPTHVGL